nr:radical SAM protein [uncultured Porphyromonas sp.]
MGITSEDVKRSLSNSPQLTFEITDACNLKCEYCGYGKFYSDYDERKSTRLSPRRAKALLDYLSSLWKSEFNVSYNQNIYISFYGGEPLMNVPFIKEIISYVEELDCPSRSFTFNMTANYRLGSRVGCSRTGDNDSDMEYNSNISLPPLSQESKQALEVR